MFKDKQKMFKTSILFFVVCLGLVVYIERSHFGYLVYMYQKATNPEIKLLEDRLLVELKSNPETFFDKFEGELEKSPKNMNTCHGMAHKLAHESFRLYGFDKSIHIAKSICGGGFIHGLIESKLGNITDYKVLEGISGLCTENNQSCNHGIGHGLMVFTKNDFAQSLLYCDKLRPMARSDCYDGVFMHIFDDEETGISKSIPERSEGFSLCNRIDDTYKLSCYFYVPRVYARLENMDIRSKDLCDNLSGYYRTACIVGSGTMFGKYMYSDKANALNMCSVFGDMKAVCVEGVRNYRDFAFKK